MASRLRNLVDTGLWALDFATLCLGAFLVAGIINVLIGYNLSALPALEGVSSADESSGTPDRPPLSNRAIVERNLFGSAMTPADPPEPPGQPIRVALSPLRASLIGTVVAGDPAFSMGMIVDHSSSETGIYRIGDTLMAQATIVEVLGQRVYLERNGRIEYLVLGEEGSLGPPYEVISQVSASPEPESGIQRTGPNRWRIDRAELKKITSNIGAVAMNVRIVPKIVEGQMQGFKLYSMRPGSIFSRLGFQNGDVIEKVNGYRLNSPEIVLEIFKKLQQARQIEVELTRRGSSTRHEYRIE